jgi:hypothetical protein
MDPNCWRTLTACRTPFSPGSSTGSATVDNECSCIAFPTAAHRESGTMSRFAASS